MTGWLPITIVTAIVSPSARPSPKITDPIMPIRALRSTPIRSISQRVAPSASTASRWFTGTARITSLLIELITGKIMIARITLAVNIPTPKFGATKRPVQPRYFSNTGPTWSRIIGTSTKIPHSPYTTLGIAASNSVKNEIGPCNIFGQTSSRKIDTASASGTAITTASSDDSTVPYTNGSAPNSPETGSHILLAKN